MRKLIFILLVLSSQVFAQEEEDAAKETVTQDNGLARDSIIGWCSAYNILQEDPQAAHDVELQAMIPLRAYQSRDSFLTWSKKSDHNMELALESGKNACQTVKKKFKNLISSTQ